MKLHNPFDIIGDPHTSVLAEVTLVLSLILGGALLPIGTAILFGLQGFFTLLVTVIIARLLIAILKGK